MVTLRSLESYLSENLLSLTGNKLSFLMGPDLLKVHEAISQSYEDNQDVNNPFNSSAASKMRVSEILNASFAKFLIEAHLLKFGGLLSEKNLLNKKGQKTFVEFQHSLNFPPDMIDFLINYTPDKEENLREKYALPNNVNLNFSLIPEFFTYIGTYQDILPEEDPQKLSKEQEDRISKEIILPLTTLFGSLFSPFLRPKLSSDSLIFPYSATIKVGSGSVGKVFLDGIHEEVLKLNSESDYKNIPINKYTIDVINLGYSALVCDTFDHYKNALQSFFLTPFYSHTVNINLHIPSPIFPEKLLKEGNTLRNEVASLSNEFVENLDELSKKLPNSFKKILTSRSKILLETSHIPISGIINVSKERNLTDLFPQIKSKRYPKSNVLKRVGKIREFNKKTLEDPLSIYGESRENIPHIDSLMPLLKMITFFSLSGKGVHGAETEGNRIKPRIKYIHHTQIK